MTPVAVVGTGRVGLSLARALARSGTTVRLLARTPRRAWDELPRVETDWRAALAACEMVVVAVPDDAIEDAASALLATGAITTHHVVLHTSGLRDRTALAPLLGTGASLGSWHPLQAFPVPTDDPAVWSDVAVALEGDVRALAAGRTMAERLALGPIIELAPDGKALYHAAAVVASNYVVVLAEIAERLARHGGAAVSAGLFTGIMQRTLRNVALNGPTMALTGPIRRGDVGTVRAHLEALTGNDRAAYVTLGREALLLARKAGLPDAPAVALERLLSSAKPVD